MTTKVFKYRSISVAITMSLIALIGAGCTSESEGNPTPQSTADLTASTSPSATRPSDGDSPREAPRVENPLDASRFLPEPCTALSQAQLTAFDVTRPGRPETTGAVAEFAGPFCTWFSESGGAIGIGFLTGNENGLSDIYKGRDEIESFIPTNIGGYPAVFANTPDLRSRGTCNIVVAISDSLAFKALEQGTLDAQGACDRAKQVAVAALMTIRGGS